jgi:hypothetical protein
MPRPALALVYQVYLQVLIIHAFAFDLTPIYLLLASYPRLAVIAGVLSWCSVQPRPAGSSGLVAAVKISAARR